MSVLERNNVNISGSGDAADVFAHGYGCDQHMWRLVTPAFADDYRLVLFDHVGAGRSDLGAYERAKYSRSQGYAGRPAGDLRRAGPRRTGSSSATR